MTTFTGYPGSFKGNAYLASTTALPSVTYNNGSAGVGATLTATGNGQLSLDGVAVGSFGDTVLVLIKDQAAQLQNGLYIVTDNGSGSTPFILTRHPGWDGGSFSPILQDDRFGINQGATQADLTFEQTTATPVTVGTDPIVFAIYDDQPKGYATLSGGTISVANTNIQSSSVVVVTPLTSATVTGILSVAITAGTGFVITSTVNTDHGSVGWVAFL